MPLETMQRLCLCIVSLPSSSLIAHFQSIQIYTGALYAGDKPERESVNS